MFHRYSTVSKSLVGFKHFKGMVLISALAAGTVFAQPEKPTTEDYLCQATPPKVLGANDTLAEVFDKDGFTNMFDGTWKGWWHDCQSSHSQNKTQGAIWKLSPQEKAMYSTERNRDGGLMLTKKKFENYEIVFDIWPSYGNDGGFFNRTPAGGTCYQTVMDYLQASSFLGTWPEGGYQGSKDFRPFTFDGAEDKIIATGNINDNNPGGGGGWTKWTAARNPTSFGCVATGCTQTDWRNLWNMDNWNQVRIKFYGGYKANTGKIHMESFFRKSETVPWVPVWFDSLSKIDTANYIGFQVHGGGRFGGTRGNWYRNIKLRYLTDQGAPIIPVSARHPEVQNTHNLRATPSALIGSMVSDYEITILDVSGRVLEKFSGKAGELNHGFKTSARGFLFLDVKTSSGISHLQVNRILE